jgi:leucyl aminopeptidase
MKISLATTSVFTQRLPAIVLFAFENERPTGPAALTQLLRRVTAKEFRGGAKQLLMLHTAGKLAPQRVLLVGLGKKRDCDAETLRRATGYAVKKLLAAGIERAAVRVDAAGDVSAVVEATILATYKFTRFKADDDNPRTQLKSLTLCVSKDIDLAGTKRVAADAQTLAHAVNYARDIANLPGNIVWPAVLADYARQLAKECGLKCTVLAKKELERGGFGGLLAVGGGSSREPHLIILEYSGHQPSTIPHRPIALVGKAMTFDTGGISIKPADHMDEMKFDKCGGVAVLGILRAAAQLKLPVNLLGVIAAAENMPSATSYRPGDIVTSYPGKEKRGVTIEVLNTDAEGRVVLGDALAYARERDPQVIIDFATLTGACKVALGDYAAGLFGNDDALIEKLRDAGHRTGERCWPMPLWQEYRDLIRSDVADHKNQGPRYGGAITGAAFLQNYVGTTPWAHLDICGTAWTTEERAYLAKGATGYGVRLLLDALRRWD